MKVAVLLLLCLHVLYTTAGQNRGPSESKLTSTACNDPQAEAAADLSLRQLNAHRKYGLVFGLKRILNVQEQHDEENGSVYYITLDVLELDCHVLSRKLWTDCKAKPQSEDAFGQCNVIFQLNKPKRIAHLHSYDCTVTSAPRSRGCRGCLSSKSLNDTEVVEVAQKSLEKFNSESDNIKYFLLGNITRAAHQVVAGSAYYVEYTIHESSCNKSDEDFSLCEPLDCESAYTGYCKAKAVAHWSVPDDKNVTFVYCKIFEPEVAVDEEQNHQAGHAEEKPDGGRKRHWGRCDRGRGKKHGHHKHRHGHGHEHKHHHKHDHKHDHDHSESHEHEHKHDHGHRHDHEHRHAPSRGGHGPQPETSRTTGTVTYLTGDETSAASGTEDKKGGKPPRRGFFMAKRKSTKPFIREFPDQASTSDQCPGQSKTVEKDIPIIEAPQDPTTIPK